MNPKDKQLAQFRINASRAKMQLTFKKIHTIKQGMDILGVNCPRKYNPESELSPALFAKIVKLYERWYVRTKNFHLPPRKEAKQILSRITALQPAPLQQVSEEEEDTRPPINSTKQKCTLIPFQDKVQSSMWRGFSNQKQSGQLLIMKVGFGKTFTYFKQVRDLYESGWIAKNKMFAPFPVLVVTKASIVEQTIRVAEEQFGFKVPQEVMVINYEALRSSFGEMFIDEKTVVINGEPQQEYHWRPFLNPVVLILDEYHCLKNTGSSQSKIVQAYNNITTGQKLVISSSATPFSKVSSAKVFAVSTGHKWKNLDLELTLTNDNWAAFAKRVASPADPDEFNKAAIKRLMKELKPYIYAPKNVHPKHRSINNVRVIDFETDSDREQYNLAWEKYLEERAKVEGSGIKNEAFFLLVQFLKFRQAAELIKASSIARMMFEDVCKGYAAISALNFKPPIAKAVNILNTEYKVPRSKISIIWGGDARFGGVQERISPEEIQKTMAIGMAGGEVDMKFLKKILMQLQVDTMGLANIPKELELGVQSREKRQMEIDRFQSGQSHYCFFTFGAGGAGLSLHHERPNLRPRKTNASATYNEMEAEQAFGRAHRINSLSDTQQDILVFRGTIEQKVLGRMFSKRGCLNIVMQHTEDSVYHEDVEAKKILSLTADGEEETVSEDEVEEIVNEL